MTVIRSPPTTGGLVRARAATRVGWLLYGAGLALVALAAGLWFVVHRPVPGAVGYEYWREAMVNGLAFATVGAVVATRRPEHPVGWLFLGAGLVSAVQLVTGEFAAAFLAASGASFGVAVATWVSDQAQGMVVGVLVSLLLLFPTGRPPSRRWWVVVWAAAVGVVLFGVAKGLAPSRYEAFPGSRTHLGLPALRRRSSGPRAPPGSSRPSGFSAHSPRCSSASSALVGWNASS